jgi:hypothetical protein
MKFTDDDFGLKLLHSVDDKILIGVYAPIVCPSMIYYIIGFLNYMWSAHSS